MSAKLRIVYNNFDKIAAKFPIAVGEIVKLTTFSIEGDVKQSMQGLKSGRVYRRGKKHHQASAPGEAPAIDIGNLVNSIHGKFYPNSNQPRGVVSTNTEYAPGLEFGTRRMAARPFMQPAAEANMKPYVSAFQRIEQKLK